MIGTDNGVRTIIASSLNNNDMFIEVVRTEHFTDHTSALANILVNDGAGHNLEEMCVNVLRHTSSQKRLAGSWRTVQQHALWGLDSNAQETASTKINASSTSGARGGEVQVRVDERQLDDLSKLPDLLTETTNIVVGDLSRIFIKHIVDLRVDLTRQETHYGQRRHVQGHSETAVSNHPNLQGIPYSLPRSSDELAFVDFATTADNITRAREGLYDIYMKNDSRFFSGRNR